MFEEPIELFDRFVLENEKSAPNLMPVNMEIQKRLSQLNWLFYKAKNLQSVFLDNHSKTGLPNFQITGELEIITECFYHFAFRLREILQTYHPAFEGFESKAIRDVRNHLLVHPEKQGKDAKIFPSFGFSDDLNIGPRIKDYNGGNHLNQDKGLFVNASEFRESLIKHFNRELSKQNA